ncbi:MULTISPECIES: LapA family protein [Corynebacterium]|uniref:LapA family protein n=1 Tax=Corynebacterium TaxID=1716 RepID=UPI001CEF93F3|nr:MULTISPECIES: lipopolysaccharide assembly protein LapA domain-containing protein [Corynebacterium]
MTTPAEPNPSSEPHPRINDDSILGSSHPTRAHDAVAERAESSATPARREDSAPEQQSQAETSATAKKKPAKLNRTLASSTWAALIIGALLLILLLVFIMQNQQPVELQLFAWTFEFPAGVGFLLAAIAGALIMAMAGIVRMFELRRQVKKARQ